MLEIAIMIEGQFGLTWPRWQSIAKLVEELGFIGLYRSDHFTNASPPDYESLELWTSLTWLACNTKRIEFGPLVTPFSFRNPVLTARMASAVDDLSDGRLTLGLGAGWQDREHQIFGFELLDPKPRFDRFDEGMEVVTSLLQSDKPVTFDGKYYRLNGATLLPRPGRKGGPKILVGGNGGKRTMAAVVKHAAEWNCNFQTLEGFSVLNTRLNELLKESGKSPELVRRSLMTGCVFGKDATALQAKIAARKRSFDELRGRGIVVGNTSQVKEQVHEFEQAGIQRIMLQWLDLDDLVGLEALAKAVL